MLSEGVADSFRQIQAVDFALLPLRWCRFPPFTLWVVCRFPVLTLDEIQLYDIHFTKIKSNEVTFI